eukprot:6329258-Prymnesium_polylepis.1
MPALPESVQCVRLLRAADVAWPPPTPRLRRCVEEPRAHTFMTALTSDARVPLPCSPGASAMSCSTRV